jgi:hypothetical protein
MATYKTLLFLALTALCLAVAELGAANDPLSPSGLTATDRSVRRFPLDCIYSTSVQKGLKAMERDQRVLNHLSSLRRAPCEPSPYVKLVRANDLAEAMTWKAEANDGSIAKPIWLVAYLGFSAANSAAWVLESATLERQTIRLVCHHDDGLEKTRNTQKYYYWMPIGELEAGWYTVAVYDSKAKTLVLSCKANVAG